MKNKTLLDENLKFNGNNKGSFPQIFFSTHRVFKRIVKNVSKSAHWKKRMYEYTSLKRTVLLKLSEKNTMRTRPYYKKFYKIGDYDF